MRHPQQLASHDGLWIAVARDAFRAAMHRLSGDQSARCLRDVDKCHPAHGMRLCGELSREVANLGVSQMEVRGAQ
jgi:hypothetical protein